MGTICEVLVTDVSFQKFIEEFQPTELLKMPNSIPDTWTLTGKIQNKYRFSASMFKDQIKQIEITIVIPNKPAAKKVCPSCTHPAPVRGSVLFEAMCCNHCPENK